jgi:thioesterase domain-containing protein
MGLSHCYAILPRTLGPDQPVYAYQAARDRPFACLADMAAAYVERLKKLQPEGPYRLFGWSFGGQVAHEIACQLQREGAVVELLALADSYARSGALLTGDDALRRLLNALARNPNSDEARELVAMLTRDYGLPAGLQPHEIADIAVITQRNIDLSCDEPHVFAGDIHYIAAVRDDPDPAFRLQGWRPYATGDQILYTVEAGHHDLFSAASADAVGRRLDLALGAVQAASAARPLGTE